MYTVTWGQMLASMLASLAIGIPIIIAVNWVRYARRRWQRQQRLLELLELLQRLAEARKLRTPNKGDQ